MCFKDMTSIINFLYYNISETISFEFYNIIYSRLVIELIKKNHFFLLLLNYCNFFEHKIKKEQLLDYLLKVSFLIVSFYNSRFV